jgi:hypothetical protein
MKRFALVLALVLVGCAAHVNHPGTANSFDSGIYDTLLTTHSVIESTKADITANAFPANLLPGVKLALNGVITAYNTLDVVYCNPVNAPADAAPPSTGASAMQCSSTSYHSFAMSGTATPAQQAQVQNAANQLNSATVALATAKKGS